ncbi:MAG: acyltransferase [Pseudomonadota bacterium]
MEGVRSDQTRLDSLQALRAVAAILVVLFHAASIWREKMGADLFQGPWDMGWAGVDLFFVLSGFIMVWVTRDARFIGPKAALHFFWKRLTRIFPIWWIFCALMGAYFLFAYGIPARPPEDGAQARFWFSMALWPQSVLPVLPVGWTLTFEMAFYALFAVLIVFPSRWRLPILIGWGGFILWSWRTQSAPPILPGDWGGILRSPMCLEFIFGAIAAQMVLSMRPPLPIGFLAIIGGLTFMVTYGVHSNWTLAQAGGLADYPRVWIFGLPAALLILGLATYEVEAPFKFPKIMTDLGDASYTLYLLHMPLLLALIRGFERVEGIPLLLSFAIFLIGGTIACVIASLYAYRFLERPLLKLSRFPLVKSRE